MSENEKSIGQKLKEELFYKKENGFEVCGKEETKKIYDFAEKYMKFLDNAKIEREAVTESIEILKKAGFKEYSFGMALKAGDKLYYNNRNKSLFAFSVGSENINNGTRIAAAHIDSPRLDLKQNPMYEDGGMGFFKTHYYGGIKKYQWTAIPLALHGVITKANGEVITVKIGEDENDPVFYINDLLPHLGAEQLSKPLGTAIPAETLNVLIGSRPFEDDKADEKIKLNLLNILNQKYDIKEEDFLSAELCAVPAFKARDVGFDRSLIGAYGHDDRVCAYPALTAIAECENPEHTVICVLADKEEIGSEGNTGMKCRLLTDLIEEISLALGGNPNVVRTNSKCLSADVSACFDPNFPEVFEKRNSALINCGCIISKFTGSRGKSSSNDASSEYLGWLRSVMASDNVIWQLAELGKVDIGGGGTVAKYIANTNVDVVDLGVPVISMHSPYELISKLDLYQAYKAFRAFYKY